MKKIVWIVIGVIIVAAIAWLFGNNNETSTDTTNTLTFAAIQEEVDADTASLYDVRAEEEYAAGHFRGAKLHDVQDINQGTYPDEPKDKKIYVYCRSGNRSSQAASALEKAGFTNVVDLGGLGRVQSMGGTLVQ